MVGIQELKKLPRHLSSNYVFWNKDKGSERYIDVVVAFEKDGGGMGPVPLLVFKTSVPAKSREVGSTPTRLRHPSRFPW